MHLGLAGSIGFVLLLASGCVGGGESNGDGSIPPPVEPPPAPEPSGLPPPPFGDGSYPNAPPVLGGTCEAGTDREGARGGIWAGGSQSGVPGEMRLLVAETGEFRWISPNEWDQQIFGTFQALDRSLTSNDAVWVWMNGLFWTETGFTGVNLHGELDEDSNLSLNYAFDSISDTQGTLEFSACNSVYTRGSSLASLAGTYVNGNRMLAIDDQGEIFLQDRSCVGNGSVELIDPRFNMYRMELTVSSCAGNEVYPVGQVFSGLAYLGDSGAGFTGDLLEYSLSSAGEDRIPIWTDLARR